LFEKACIEMVNENMTNQDAIDSFCKKIGVELPKDYQDFLLKSNGMVFKQHPCFYIPEIGKAAELLSLYGFNFNDFRGGDLEKTYHYNFNYSLNGSTLVIGHCYTGGKGNLSVMLVQTDNVTGVYACDLFYDDFFFEESSAANNTFRIADSFGEFVNNLECPQDDGTVYFPQYDFSYSLLK